MNINQRMFTGLKCQVEMMCGESKECDAEMTGEQCRDVQAIEKSEKEAHLDLDRRIAIMEMVNMNAECM